MKYDTKALEAKMKKTISAYETNLETIRAGQANPAVLNRDGKGDPGIGCRDYAAE